MTDAAGPAVELIDVARRFVTPDGRALTALRSFNLTVRRGEFCAVVGPTGCGKSTTLTLIAGLATPTAGEVRIMGKPVTGIDPRVGFVFQQDAVFPWKTVIDNVVAGPLYRGKPRAAADAETKAQKIPMLPNYLLAALGGTLWYFQFFFYSMGESQMGKFGFSSWTLHMGSIILFSTLWGFTLREWKGSSAKTQALVWLGILSLVGSTVIIGYGNYIASLAK